MNTEKPTPETQQNPQPSTLPLFELGQVVATPGALDSLHSLGLTGLELLRRHHRGDWGDLDQEDIATNNAALQNGSRLFSSYQVNQELKIWIITEADRSVTTLLLPEEY